MINKEERQVLENKLKQLLTKDEYDSIILTERELSHIISNPKLMKKIKYQIFEKKAKNRYE